MLQRTHFIYLLLFIATISLCVSLFLTLSFLSTETEHQQLQFKESLTWQASQLEREGLNFVRLLLLFESGDPQVDADSVRQAFDIFWSRTVTLQQGQLGGVVLQLAQSRNVFTIIAEQLKVCDPQVAELDQNERQLVRQIYQDFSVLLRPVHRLVQEATNAEMLLRENNRQQFLQIKQDAVWLLLASFCSGTLLAGLLLTRQRALNRLSKSLEQRVERRTNELSQANQALQNEVLQHRQARDEMGSLRNLLENIVNLMPSLLIGVDSRGRIMQWNRQSEEATGVAAEDAVGKPVEEVMPYLADWLDSSQSQLQQGLTVIEHKRSCAIGPAGSLVDLTAYPLSSDGAKGAVIRIDDVTHQTKLDELMIQSEKMISIGGLAAGMAHEINNPLAGIVQNLQVIERRFKPEVEANQRAALECGTSMDVINHYLEERKLLKMFAMIHESSDRAVKIVANMLSFSREKRSDFIPCSITQLLDYAVGLAKNDFSLKKSFDFRSIEITSEYETDLPEVECQANQLQQVFYSLLKNAAQALCESEATVANPQISLRVKRKEEQVRIEIQDNGPGMADDVRKRIFEPFFTTKEIGSGTGLGLFVAYKIINDNHGGMIELESSRGQGSLFVISLPLHHA